MFCLVYIFLGLRTYMSIQKLYSWYELCKLEVKKDKAKAMYDLTCFRMKYSTIFITFVSYLIADLISNCI